MKTRDVGWIARRPWRRHPVPIEVDRAIALDGAHIWITLDAPGSGRVVAVATTAGNGRTTFPEVVVNGLQTLVLDPAALPGSEEMTYRLYLEVAGTMHPLCGRLTPKLPTRAPCSPEGTWQYSLVGSDHSLELHRLRAPSVRPIAHFGQNEETIEIGWTGSDDGMAVLLDSEGRQVATIPVTQLEGSGLAGIRLSRDLALPDQTRVSVTLRAAGVDVPLARRRNDLVRPDGAVLLPELTSEAGTLRLVWAPDGTLQAIWKAVG